MKPRSDDVPNLIPSRTRLFHAGALLAGSCLGLNAAVAAPLNPKHVPADAAWMAHIDIEAVISSGLADHIQEIDGDIDLDELNEFTEQTGLDPERDLSGVTIFGTTNPDAEDPVVLVYGRGGSSKLIDMIQRELPGVEPRAEAGALEYQWEDDGTKLTLRLSAAGGAGDMPWTLVICEDAERCDDALATLRAENGGAQAAPAGSIVYVRVTNLGEMADMADDGMAGAILGAAENVELSVSCAAESLAVWAVIGCKDADSANSLFQAGQGLLALGRMAIAGEPEAAEVLPLLDALEFKVEGVNISIDLSVPFDMLEDSEDL